MAEEYSEQTQAIVDRLKAEGQLIRNTGTNSIKTMNVKLDKFAGLLKSINNELMFQTDMLRQSLEIEQTIQREKQLAEVDVDPTPKPTTSAGKPGKNDDEEKKKNKSLTGILGGILGSLRNILVKGALVFGAGVLGSQFIRGFIDERTDGAFTKFFEDVDWKEMGSNMKLLALTLKEKVVSFTNFLKDPVAYIMSGMSATDAATAGVLTAAGLASIITSGSDQGSKDRKTRVGNLVRFGALGLMLTGVGYASDSLREVIDEQDWSKEKIGSLKKGDLAAMGIDVAEGALKGASIGYMFGPKGAAVGAVLGATLTLGFKAYEWWNDRKKKNQAELAAQLAAAEALYANQKDKFDDLVVEISKLPIEQQNKIIDSLTPEQQTALNLAIEKNPLAAFQEQITYAQSQVDSLKLLGGPAYQDAVRQLQLRQQEYNDFLTSGYYGGGLTGAPTTSYAEQIAAQIAAEERARTEAGEARFKSLQPFRDADRIYRERMATLSTEDYMARARAMSAAELRTMGVRPGDDLRAYTSPEAEEYFRQMGKVLKQTFEDVGLLPQFGLNAPVIYFTKQGDVFKQGDTYAPNTKTEFTNVFGGNSGTEFSNSSGGD